MHRKPLNFPIKLDTALSDFSYNTDVGHNENLELHNFPLEQRDTKNNELAKIYLREGKSFFRKEKYLASLMSYTKAIQHAVIESELLPTCYAKRSAVLYRVGLFEECLADIKLATGIPEHKQLDLTLRRASAEKMMEEQKEQECVSPDECVSPVKIPGECVRTTEGRDPRIVATRDIDSGDVVCEELVRVVAPSDLNFNLHCSHCLLTSVNPIECLFCTQVQYCTENCRNAAWDLYHIHECKIIKMLQPYDRFCIVVRILFSLYHRTLNRDEMNQHHTLKVVMDILQLRFPYKDIDLLNRRINQRLSARLYYLIDRYTNFFEEWTHKHNTQTITKGLILKLLYITRYNCKRGYMVKELPGGEVVASMEYQAIAFSHNLFKLSCAPNVYTRLLGPRHWVSVAIENIRKDQELTLTRKDYFWNVDLESRRQYMSQIPYTCECVACKIKWLVEDKLPCRSTPKIREELDKVEKKIESVEYRTNPEELNKVLRYLHSIAGDVKKPSKEYAQRARCLIRAYEYLMEFEDALDVIIEEFPDVKYYNLSDSEERETINEDDEDEEEGEYIPPRYYTHIEKAAKLKEKGRGDDGEEGVVYIPPKASTLLGKAVRLKEKGRGDDSEEEGAYIPPRASTVLGKAARLEEKGRGDDSEEEGAYSPPRASTLLRKAARLKKKGKGDDSDAKCE